MYSIFLILSLVGEPNVDALIEQLGDENYARRESASAQLAPLTESILPKLKAARQHPDFEVRWRTETMVRNYYASVVPSNKQKWPWIDCLPKDYPNRDKVLESTYNQFKDSIGQDAPIESTTDTDKILRDATSKFVFTLLEQNKSKQEIVALLDTMVKNEKTIENLPYLSNAEADPTYPTQPRRWRIVGISSPGYYETVWYLRPINPDNF